MTQITAFDGKVGKRLIASGGGGVPQGQIGRLSGNVGNRDFAEPTNSAMLHPVMWALRAHAMLTMATPAPPAGRRARASWTVSPC